MARIHVRPPDDYWSMTEEEQLAWIRQLQAEVLGDYDEAEAVEGPSALHSGDRGA